MLLYGEPKVKKSWLVQHLAFCVSMGEEWLGFHSTQARVLLANFEISPISYHWRLKEMARRITPQEQMLWETSPMLKYLDDDHNFNEFRVLVRELQPKVIVLDCLAACFGGDENDGQQMANWIGRMSELKAEFESSLVIVHHTNKNMLTSSATDRARGHSRLTGWVDTLCFMTQQPSGIQLQFKARQATREIPNTNILFNNYLWSVRGEANERQQAEQADIQ